MTARPSGAFCSPPSPSPSAIGTMPMIMASAVIKTGRRRMWPAAIAASIAVLPSRSCSLAKVIIRMLLAVATPTLAIAPIIDSTLKVVCVRNSIHKMPANAPGNASDNDERIGPRLEVDDHQEVNERGGEDEAEAELAERGVHAFDLAAHVDRAARRKFRAKLVNDFHDLIGNATEIRALDVGVDVEHRLHVGMADDGGCFAALRARHTLLEQLRMRRILSRRAKSRAANRRN